MLMLGAVPSGFSAPGVLVVDEIEIEGVTRIPTEEIQSAIEVQVGEPLDRRAVSRTAKNIQALYELKGYSEIEVSTELNRRAGQRTVLRIQVKEGTATRIAGFKVLPIGALSADRQAFWQRFEGKLRGVVQISPGDLFDQEKITEITRKLEEALVAEEFVGGKVTDVRFVTTPAPSAESSATPKGKDGRWVTLEFHVDLGDRVTFGYRGNQRLSYNDLSAVIEERRSIGFGRDYVKVIERAIEDKYRSLAYANVVVRSQTYEKPGRQERHVTFFINEGERTLVDSLDFDGNTAFTGEDLKREFLERASQLVQRGYYVESDVESAAQLLVDWIKSQGYLSAKLVAVNRTFLNQKNSVRLLIYIYEGEQTMVREVAIKGATVLKEPEILELLAVRPDNPLNLFAFSEGIENLKTAYRQRGYLSVQIVNEDDDSVVKYSRKNRIADIQIDISEGPQYRASSIGIEGLGKTKPEVVQRELEYREGDVLEETKLSESEANLRRLGIFSSVRTQMRDDPSKPGYKQVKLSISEGTPGRWALGVGVRNDLGARAFGELAYTNVGGRNHTASLSGSINRRFEEFRFHEYDLKVGYVWPWFLVSEVYFRPELGREKKQFKLFDAETTAFSATFDRQIWKKLNLVAALTYSLERVDQSNAQFAVDNNQLTIGALTPSLRLDLRDSPLAPTRGFFAWASLELADSLFGSQRDPFPIGYYRFQFRSDGIVPLGKGVTWFLSFRSGYARNNVAPPDSTDQRYSIPLIKQFALGGPGSLRGFGLQELNKQSKAILGTLSYVNYRTQIDFPIFGSMRAGPFLDAANLLVDRFSFGILRYGAGVGLHYQTPVGPVNFDWGFKLDPQPGEDTYRFHFSVGLL
ncbi:MAG: POTRA domain-containing protein [Bacteriovoracia bacterium]